MEMLPFADVRSVKAPFWFLKESIIHKFSVFGRKIFGPTEEDNGIWRIKANKELDGLIKRRNLNYCDVLLTVHLSIFISVINQLDAQKFCFTISLFHTSTCFEHMCSSSGGQNCITQPLVSSHL